MNLAEDGSLSSSEQLETAGIGAGSEVRCQVSGVPDCRSKDRLTVYLRLLPGWLSLLLSSCRLSSSSSSSSRATGLSLSPSRAPATKLPFIAVRRRSSPTASRCRVHSPPTARGKGGLPACRDDVAHSRAEHTTRTPTRNRSRSLRWRLIDNIRVSSSSAAAAAGCLKFQPSRVEFYQPLASPRRATRLAYVDSSSIRVCRSMIRYLRFAIFLPKFISKFIAQK